MDTDDVWRVIDAERVSLADLLDGLTAAQWQAPSLCAGWRVSEVAAHLTLAQMGVRDAAVAFARARLDFNRMIYDTARRQAKRLPAQRLTGQLRAMAGSRRKAPGVTELEPLIDVLVHGQDITVPLGLERSMPAEAAMTAASRVWPDLYPFRAARRLRGLRFAATDCDWSAGDAAEGLVVTGPIDAILLALTGRPAAVTRLSGPGAAELEGRLRTAGPRFVTPVRLPAGPGDDVLQRLDGERAEHEHRADRQVDQPVLQEDGRELAQHGARPVVPGHPCPGDLTADPEPPRQQCGPEGVKVTGHDRGPGTRPEPVHDRPAEHQVLLGVARLVL